MIGRELLLETLYNTLQMQLSIYTGKKKCSLAPFQEWYNNNHLKKVPTICECCKSDIEKVGHKDDCEIVKDYAEFFQL